MTQAIDNALDLPVRAIAVRAAADLAELRRAEVCAAAPLAQNALAQMASVATASSYMAVASLASLAHGAEQSLIEADQQALIAHTAILDSALVLAQVTATRVLADGSKAAADVLFVPLDLNGNHGNALDVQNARALRQHGKDTSDHAETAVNQAAAIASDAGPSHGTAAVAASLVASKRMARAVSNTAKVMAAAQNLPAAPASCVNAQQFGLDVAALQAAANHPALGVDRAQVAASATLLDGHATAADPVLRQKMLAIPAAGATVAALKLRAVYSNPDVRQGNANQFASDVTNIDKLAADAHGATTALQADAQQAVNALLPVNVQALAVPGATAALRARLQAIYGLAHNAAGLIPYDPAANSAAAKAALDQGAIADAANHALQLEARRADAALDRARRVVGAARSERDHLQALDAQRLKANLQTAWEGARERSRSAKETFKLARENLSDVSVIMQACLLAGAKRSRLEAALDKVKSAQAQLAANAPTPDTVQAIDAVAQAEAAQQVMVAQLARIGLAQAAARACAQAAKTAADAAVDQRIDQLCAEGHGPQRHEGAPTTADLGERAMYGVDPESHTQLDAESGAIHSAEVNASKFKTKAAFVRAEALARAAYVPATGSGTVLLSAVGADVAESVTCIARPASRDVTLAGAPKRALRVPTLPAYVDDGTQPPPTRPQMDTAAMQVQIAASTRPTVFAPDAQAFAVLRTDTHGKVYLRTMWPQNRPP